MDWFHDKSPSDIHIFENVLGDWHFLGVLVFSILLDSEIWLEAPFHAIKDIPAKSFHLFGSSVKATADKT